MALKAADGPDRRLLDISQYAASYVDMATSSNASTCGPASPKNDARPPAVVGQSDTILAQLNNVGQREGPVAGHSMLCPA